MSFEPDNIDYELTVEDLLRMILRELRYQRIILEEISGFNVKGTISDDD